MTRESTINKYKSELEAILASGKTVNTYYDNPNTFYKAMASIIEDYTNGQSNLKEVVDLYNKVKYGKIKEDVQDNDGTVETIILRDDEGKITGYYFKVYRKDETPVCGTLSRDEMNIIYRLYSYYGSSITQREVSRFFPDYSLIDFKRILRAFHITKASGPFAPHMYEEKTEEELKEIHLREKENDFLKRIEKDELSDLKLTATKLARENSELKKQLNSITEISIKDLNISPIPFNSFEETGKSLSIYLSDLHIGATCESNTLYPNNYDKAEISRRLSEIFKKIASLGHLDTLIINLLGDNMDGMDNQTARRDHIMPQCMDNMEQLDTFISIMSNFIVNCQALANTVKVYSVKCGNHDGFWGYTATLALQNILKNIAPSIQFTLFKDFIGKYEFNGHTILICHGKDEKFMKKGLPLNLDERSKVMVYEWLEANNIHGDNIHFIKGDLHSNALNSCLRFDYRNVLSLFGASDYSNFNFSRNSYGVSYDLYIGDNRTLGTFENV